jgi:hypothetical protein
MRKIVVPEGVSLDGVFNAKTIGQSNIVQAQGITKSSTLRGLSLASADSGA